MLMGGDEGGGDVETLPQDRPSVSVTPPATVSPLPTTETTPTTIESAPTQLIDLVPQTVGSFELIEWDNAPQFAQTFNANQAIEVEFRRPDGKQVLHYLFSYNTHTEATIEKDNYVRAFQETGFVITDEGRTRGINYTRLAAGEEVVVWSNDVLMGVVEGPFDVAAGFFLELPY